MTTSGMAGQAGMDLPHFARRSKDFRHPDFRQGPPTGSLVRLVAGYTGLGPGGDSSGRSRILNVDLYEFRQLFAPLLMTAARDHQRDGSTVSSRSMAKTPEPGEFSFLLPG